MSQNDPVEVLKSGLIRAAVWRNEVGERAWYSVTLSRLFQKDGARHRSKSFPRAELPRVREVVDLALQWIDAQPDGAAAPGAAAQEFEERAPVVESAGPQPAGA
jgi:hypothetical protein